MKTKFADRILHSGLHPRQRLQDGARRIVSLLLAVTLLLGAAPVLAAEISAAVLLNETFNDTITNAMPNSASFFGDGSIVQAIPEGGGKILRVRNRWESAIVQFTFNVGANSEIVLDTKVKVGDDHSEKALLQYANAANRFTLVTRKRNGEAYDMNGRSLGRIPANEWVRLTAVLNLETLRYELFVNGKLKAHRGVLQDPGAMAKAGFTSESNADNETTLFCDYFRIYTGKEVMPESFFPSVPLNETVKNTTVEHASQPKYKPSLIFELDSESQTPGQSVIGMPLYSGTAAVTVDPLDSNRFFQLTYEKGAGPIVAANSRVESYPCMVIQHDVRVNRKSRATWTVQARDAAANGNAIYVIYVLPGGRLAAADGKTILSDESAENGWINVAAVMDFRTKDIDYYVGGELVLEDFPFPEEAKNIASTIWEVRWSAAAPSVTGTHHLDLDNILLYKGIEPSDKNTLLGGGSVMESEEELDYTLDSSPLAPDMKAFRAVPEAQSAQENPSSYLTDYASAKKTYQDAICVVAGTPNVWVKNGKYASDYPFYWDGNHILGPAPTLAAFINRQLDYNESAQTAKIGNITAKAGDAFITVDGKQYPSESTVQVIDGVLYIPLREFTRYGMNKFYGESFKGFAVIAPDERPYHFVTNAGGSALMYTVGDYSHMMAYLILDRYNASSLQQIFNERIASKPYPRVLTMKEDAPGIKAATETDPRMKEFSDLTLRDAQSQLGKTLNIPDVPGVQINGIPSITLPEEMYYAYYMTGDRAYVDKVLEFADYLLNLQNWNGDAHMLSTSWICLYLAYTYDLFHDELTQEKKDEIAYACINKAIKYHREYMYGTDWNNWSIMDYNWNVICNAGPMLAAMIFLGEGYDDALLLDTIEKAQVSLGYFMHYFAPDGAGWESMGYTNYILSYLCPLLDGIMNYFDDDLGFMDYPGLDKVGEFLVNCTGSKNGLAFHDDTGGAPACTALSMWFTKLTGDYEAQRRNIDQLYKNMAQYNINGITLLKNYMPNPPETEYTDQLDKSFRALELVGSRDAWGEGAQTFMSAHGGYNNCAHAQLDMGNFYFEANGKMFADDMGRETYEIQGSCYAERPEGHNLWVVNPDESGGQNTVAFTNVKMVESKPKGVIYTADLLPAYYGQVEATKRGYMLSHDRKVFTVQDEIVPFEGANEFYWFWHTTANIEVDDGNKTATLTLDGKQCTIYFDANVDFTITKQDKVEPLPLSPKIPAQLQLAQHKKMKKISVNFFSDGEPVTFRAVAVPYGQKYEREALAPIDEWQIPDGSITEGYDDADAIYLNGTPLEGFKPHVYDYTIYYPGYYDAPEVTVETQGKIAEIIPPSEANSNTLAVRIESASNPGNFRTYTVTLQSDSCVGLPEDGEQIAIVGAEASEDDGNIPTNVFDGDESTRWSSANDQWITIDLGEVKEFNTLAMMLYGNDGRRLDYEIYTSEDNETFTLASDDLLSAGVTSGWEYTQFKKAKARYIRLTCHGSTIVPYNSIVEMRVYNVPEK